MLASTLGGEAAFALKHGKLTRKKARLVTNAHQVKGEVPTLSDGFFLDRDFVGVEVIMIEMDDGTRTRADTALLGALQFIEREMLHFGL